jgi:hypothetical protein
MLETKSVGEIDGTIKKGSYCKLFGSKSECKRAIIPIIR